jgi:sec-independent protein translocase protein TatA
VPVRPGERASLSRVGIDNPVHILFLAAVALVVLGPKRLPELARAAGKSMREFREALNGGVVEEESAGGQSLSQTATQVPTSIPQPPAASEDNEQVSLGPPPGSG